ncbi:MAG: GIY-YIG nuclease family protein [Saprospiraceae bacterium]|nr:GIY-YIG nuclease family protein [Saprospiraceae bacterium]
MLEINQKIALYEQDLQYFQRFSLYFLKIQSSDYHLFYKIGLTSRTLKERLSEIQADVNSVFATPTVEVIFQLPKVAFLEPFFKRKYRTHQYRIADFTEYFRFEAFEVVQLINDFEATAFYLKTTNNL